MNFRASSDSFALEHLVLHFGGPTTENWRHDGVVTPHPPITRALQSVVKALPNISLIDWTPHLHDKAWA